MHPSDVERTLREYMTRTFLLEFGKDASADTDLFEAGFIDSFGFIELVGFIEQTFGISLSEDDLASADTSSLAGTTRLVVDRLAHKDGASATGQS